MSFMDMADYNRIYISMLIKIEQEVSQIQLHMIKKISDIFDIVFNEFQINSVNSRLYMEHGNLQFIDIALLFNFTNRNKGFRSYVNPLKLQNEK